MIHILHIRKTGGSAVGDALGPFVETLGVRLASHDMRLSDLPPGDRVVFTVRDPVQRFCSGFNSRLRCGRPRNNRPWTAAEARAFSRFATPNALAEALAATDDSARTHAEEAMQAIPHMRPLSFWLGSPSELEARSDDIALIMWQRELDADFALLCRLLGARQALRLPTDDVASHRTPAGFSTMLTQKGRAAVEAHYAEDVVLYRQCLEMRAARASEMAGR